MHRLLPALTFATLGASAAAAAPAADRAIPLSPIVAMSWGFLTPGTEVKPHRTLGVGFWQRASGAKPGVGANFVSVMEVQLPEAMPNRIRSATFQFSGKQSQCVGAEPVVVDVYAYAADGRSDVGDATAGTRVAQLRADCNTNPAFNQPIDVTAIVRQLSVPSGIRHVGFNIRKANHRQGPGLFSLGGGKLTVVLADQPLTLAPAAQALPPAGGSAGQNPASLPQGAGQPTATGPNGLVKAFGTLVRGAGSKASREQARGEALDGIANLPATQPAAAATPKQATP